MPQYKKGRTEEEEERFLRFRAVRLAIRKRDAASLIWSLLDLYLEDVSESRKPDVSSKTFEKCLDVVGTASRKRIANESGEEDLPPVDDVAAWLKSTDLN
jgi:hypothetical protein